MTTTETETATAKLESIIGYYESEDFMWNYAELLLEDTHAVANRIVENSKRWDVINNREFPLSFESALLIVDYLQSDYSEYIEEYNNYYVGYDSIDSIEYGEQEESCEDIPRDLAEQYDFYVDDDNKYMYRSMDGYGVHIKLAQEDAYEILDEIKELATES